MASIEDVLKGIKAHFESYLQTALEEIELARGVDIPVWEKMETFDILGFYNPKIEILPTKGNPDYGSELQPLVSDFWMWYDVIIFVTHSGSDPEEVQYNLVRYAEAFEKLVRDDSRFGDRFNWVQLDEQLFSPMYEAEKERQLIKIFTQTLRVRV